MPFSPADYFSLPYFFAFDAFIFLRRHYYFSFRLSLSAFFDAISLSAMLIIFAFSFRHFRYFR